MGGGEGFVLVSTVSYICCLYDISCLLSVIASDTGRESSAASTKESKTETSRKKNNGEEVQSIYLDDGTHKKKPETVKPQRKLTKVPL